MSELDYSNNISFDTECEKIIQINTCSIFLFKKLITLINKLILKIYKKLFIFNASIDVTVFLLHRKLDKNVDRGTRLVHSTRKWPFNFGTHQLIVPALNFKT